MSDQSDRDRRGDDQRRRRMRRGGGYTRPGSGGRAYHANLSSRRDAERPREQFHSYSNRLDQWDSPTGLTRPIILAKPNIERPVPVQDLSVETVDSVDPASTESERPITVLRSRDDNSSSFAGPASPVGDAKLTYQILRSGTQSGLHDPTGSSSDHGDQDVPEMKDKVKLIDEMQQWCDMTIEQLLIDQTDFLVVGVMGLHATGKSSLLSFLTGSNPHDSRKLHVFPPENRDIIISGSHCTSGVDMYITSDRVIYLDTQPVLSTSVLDQMSHTSGKSLTDYGSPENGVEIQSLQIAAFLMSVCHVILLVEDWFTDLNLLNFVHTAEMLKPAVSTTGNIDSTSTSTDNVDYCPHFVFVQNKAPSEYFTVNAYKSMQTTLTNFFRLSNLKHSGSVNMVKAACVPGINDVNISENVNLFLLPSFTEELLDETPSSTPSQFRGHPSYTYLLSNLRNQLLAVPRLQFTRAALTEKNWFHYAAKVWDQVKKSQLIAEYNRFLP